MTPANLTELILALLLAALVAAGLGWTRYGGAVWPPVSALLLAGSAVVAALSARLDHGRPALTALVTTCGLLAVVGGGPVTTAIFGYVDRSEHAATHTSLGQAGEVLRGGAWIGALERLAVFAGLAAGFPEGVAVVLAIKGVGRYPDLRADASTATTERFIIGTFASVLWAAGCAGLVVLAG